MWTTSTMQFVGSPSNPASKAFGSAVCLMSALVQPITATLFLSTRCSCLKAQQRPMVLQELHPVLLDSIAAENFVKKCLEFGTTQSTLPPPPKNPCLDDVKFMSY